MRRLVAAACLGLAAALLLALGVGAGGEGGGYRVRAIFDNVAFAVPGEDVKVAGAKVGVIESMDVTEDKKAAVTLRIEDERFTPFRTNAHCTVRPQSLIGEKYVECDPGTALGAKLIKIERGDGKGEHLLPVLQTSSPVDLDLVNDVLRLPYRQRLAIILNELGTGLAGRGEELNAVIHRANPALRETDQTLRILAGQNKVLAKLAVDSDSVLGPLAREKRRVSDFIVQANATAQASAERRGDIRASLQRLPRFLVELRGLMGDLGGFADQATPVTRDLGAAAPGLNRFVGELGPFTRASLPAIRSLGRATQRGRPALLRTRPLVEDLIRLGRSGRPLATDLDRLTRSLDKTGGLERALDFVFYGMTSINGFDSVGHYLRASLIANTCSVYSTTPITGCNATFVRSGASGAGPRLARVRSRKDEPQAPPVLHDLLSPAPERGAAPERPPNVGPADPALDYLLKDGP
jgi:phospholipid/cholesterol/gamma-HCH transport system substrate-binding protein